MNRFEQKFVALMIMFQLSVIIGLLIKIFHAGAR